MPMTHDEIQAAITRTKAEIEEVKQQIAKAADPREETGLSGGKGSCSICSCGILIS